MLNDNPLAAAAYWLDAEVTRLTTPWSPDAATVTRALAVQAPHTGRAHHVTARFGHPSSVLSRYQRAGLPSPKAQMAVFRLALAFLLSKRGCTTAEAALLLDHSSPQSFHRTVKRRFGCVWPRVLYRYPTAADFWTQVVGPVMRWDDDAWTTLRALGPARRGSILDQRVEALQAQLQQLQRARGAA